jgi:hypothetical protein
MPHHRAARSRRLLVVGLLVLVASLLVLGATRTAAPGVAAPTPPSDRPLEPPASPRGPASVAEPPAGAFAAAPTTAEPAGEPAGAEAPDAAPEPAPQPPAPAADANRGRLVVHHVGDVLLDPGQVAALTSQGPDAVWDGVRTTFATADLVLANLECTASDRGEPQAKEFVFRCDLDALPAMRTAGVDVVNLANNPLRRLRRRAGDARLGRERRGRGHGRGRGRRGRS